MVGMTVGNQEVINVRKGGVVVVKQAVRTMITAIDQEMRLVFHNKKIRLVQGFWKRRANPEKNQVQSPLIG